VAPRIDEQEVDGQAVLSHVRSAGNGFNQPSWVGDEPLDVRPCAWPQAQQALPPSPDAHTMTIASNIRTAAVASPALTVGGRVESRDAACVRRLTG
jgi:hypothetical protein